MKASVKSSGFIVFMEPVLSEVSQEDEEEVAEKQAQMKARKRRWFEQLFQQIDLQLLASTFYKQSNQLLTDVMVFVLQAGATK